MLFLFFVFYTYLTNGLGKRFTDSENFVKKNFGWQHFFLSTETD